MEIERRYLLSELPPEALKSEDVFTYEHGFLPGPGIIRERVTFRSRPPQYKRTVKIGTGLVRQEFQEELNVDTFDVFWKLTEGRRVTGRRWTIIDPDMTLLHKTPIRWEVTGFLKRDLFLAEIELPSDNTEVTLPPWLAPYVTREVTTDERFEAWNLAR